MPSNGSEQLETAPYLVKLEDSAARLYARMRELEGQWLGECEQRGCTLVQSKRRQCVVLVPPGTEVPALDLTPYHEWREAAVKLADEQGKKDSVASRSSQPPTWLTLSGERYSLTEAAPDYRVQRLRYRTAQAARGARMGPDDATQYIQGLISRAESAIESSLKYGHRSRLPEQEERLALLETEFAEFEGLVTKARLKNLLISVQALSGEAWRITARTTDKQSVHASISTIAVMPCTADVLVEPAGNRERKSKAVQQVKFEKIRMRAALYER